MAPAGFCVPSLVPPLTQFQTTCPSTATGQTGFEFVDIAAPPGPRVRRDFIARALAGAGH